MERYEIERIIGGKVLNDNIYKQGEKESNG